MPEATLRTMPKAGFFMNQKVAAKATPMTVTFTGDASLRKRPMGRVTDPLARMGARFDWSGGDGVADLRFRKTGEGHAVGYRFEEAQGREWLVLAGFLGATAHLVWTRALKLGDVSALTPISFMQLPIVVVFGYLLFGEELDRWTLVGAAIIFGANGYIAHREASLARRAASVAATSAAKPGQ